MLNKTLRFGQQLLSKNSLLVSRPLYSFQDYKDTDRHRSTSTVNYNNMPADNHFASNQIPTHEIQARILKVASSFEEINLKAFDWEQKFDKLGLDSLNRVAFITSVEHEFNIVFPDRVFDNLSTPTDMQRYLQSSNFAQ